MKDPSLTYEYAKNLAKQLKLNETEDEDDTTLEDIQE